jgi:hypothetical protein
MMRQRHWVILGSALLLGCVAYALGLHWVKSAVIERLDRRGFTAAVESVGLRPLAVSFGGVVAVHRSGVLRVSLPEVRAEFGFSGIKRLVLRGGEVELTGDVNEVRKALLGSQEPDAEPAAGREPTPIAAQQLALSWSDPIGAGSGLTITDLNLEREGGFISARLGVVDGKGRGARGHFVQVVARVASRDLAVASLHVGGGEASVDLNTLKPPAPAAPPPVDDKPSKGRKVVPPALGWLALKPGRGPELRHLVQQAAGIVSRRIPNAGALQLSQMVLSVREGEQLLTIGPGMLYARRDADKVQFGFSSNGSQTQSALDMHIEAPLEAGPVEVRIKGGPVALAELGIKPGNFGLQEVERTSLNLDTQLTLSADGTRAEFSSIGEIRGLAVQQERLAPHALTDIDVGWSIGGQAQLDGSEVNIKAGRLGLGEVNGVADIHVSREAERLRIDGTFRVEAESCAEMFDALPNGSVPLLAGAKMTGDFSWQGGIHFDTDHLTNTKAIWNMRNHCRFSHIPDDANPGQFRDRFSLHVPDYDGQPMGLRTGPGSSHWAPLDEISPFMERAVLTTEDGGFWSHHGFDSGAIEGAIRRNLERGEFSRGASTVSMQLAKNLYLERDKYIARKVQEALLTMLLEQELRKAEILELYFNVIEYGPGVYGIRSAAKHYFGSTPSELSVAQCFFLASILPRPKAQYFDEGGHLIPLRANLIRNLMKIAHERERLNAEELEKGLAEELRFGVPSLDSNPYRNPDGTSNDESAYPAGETPDDM